MSYPPATLPDHFAVGHQGEAAMSAGLMQDSAAQNDMTPGQFAPHSILNQLKPSMAGTGNSDDDYQRMLPDGKMLPSDNSNSQAANEGDTTLRMKGVLPI